MRSDSQQAVGKPWRTWHICIVAHWWHHAMMVAAQITREA